MLKFPEISRGVEPPVRPMPLVEYARYRERCLRRNPKITPLNCLDRRNREKAMVTAFSLGARAAGKTT